MRPAAETKPIDTERELAAFDAGDTEAATFTHAEHVRLAFEMLERDDFETAVGRFARGLRRIASRAGAAHKYHSTVTVAFLALISERRLRGDWADWPTFAAANPDLFDKRVVEQWYPARVLADDVSRRTFVLPAIVAR